jgi:hypothetical protein
MKNTGLRNPATNALICLAMFLGGSATIWSGVSEMNALGHETNSSAAKIGIGFVVAIFGFLFMFNFLWGVRVINAARRGDNEIARWTVFPETFDEFRNNEERRNAGGELNDYKPPSEAPAGGVEVIFTADGVLVGNTFFGLASTGLASFQTVQVLPENPLCIEFGTSLVTGSNLSVPRLHTIVGVLRIPVSRTATEEAKKVLAHFQKVLAREIIVKPDFWRRRIRLGLATAFVSTLIVAAGFGLAAADMNAGAAPVAMAAGGAVLAVGGLILALLAWTFSEKQHHG